MQRGLAASLLGSLRALSSASAGSSGACSSAAAAGALAATPQALSGAAWSGSSSGAFSSSTTSSGTSSSEGAPPAASSSGSSSRWWRPPALPPAGARTFSTRRPNSLSMRKANNLASRLAVEEVLGADWREQQQQPGSRKRGGGGGGAPPPAEQQAAPVVVPTAIPPLLVNPEPQQWAAIGRVEGEYTVEPQDAFAVVQLGPFQYKVTADDIILHPKLVGAEVNDVIALGKVLLVGTPQDTTIGRPFIPGAVVVAAVESHFRDAKVHVFKKKVRKRYSKLKGHRAQITSLRVLQILPEGLPEEWQRQQLQQAGGSGGSSEAAAAAALGQVGAGAGAA